ncbi:cell division protein FtsQ/DivIB, partial [Streptomyces sp. SID3212]|uniref:cell division protein FtsQ/DivIB n=1 Tax=Streptomyces sp. SID3212 TaxID=2690259 RepID=UPI0013716880
ALAGDPRVTAAARAALEAVHRFGVGRFGEAGAASAFFSVADDDAGVDLDAALRRLLDPEGGAGLPELMEAYARGVGLTVWFTPPAPLDREGNWYREFHHDRGFPVGHGPADAAREALARYSRLAGVRRADVLAFREAVIGWQLSLDRHSLIEVLLASHTLGLGDTAERAAALGDAVHLYQWADDALSPRTRSGRTRSDAAGQDGGLRLPHRRLYGTGVGRFPPEATGSGTVPDGLVLAVQRGERVLSGEYDPDKLPGREEALLDWRRRHGGSPLDALDRAHVTALHLLGGPDAALLG